MWKAPGLPRRRLLIENGLTWARRRMQGTVFQVVSGIGRAQRLGRAATSGEGNATFATSMFIGWAQVSCPVRRAQDFGLQHGSRVPGMALNL